MLNQYRNDAFEIPEVSACPLPEAQALLYTYLARFIFFNWNSAITGLLRQESISGDHLAQPLAQNKVD